MSFTDIKTKNQGFTIVELLIVVVVIAILAAITIVSYNGITNRANASSAKSAASSVAKKAEAYANDPDTTGYPISLATMTAASAASKTYYVTGITYDALASQPTNPATVRLEICGTQASAAATALSQVTASTGVKTGMRVLYWNHEKNAISAGSEIITTGQVSGNSAGGYAITCYATTS